MAVNDYFYDEDIPTASPAPTFKGTYTYKTLGAVTAPIHSESTYFVMTDQYEEIAVEAYSYMVSDGNLNFLDLKYENIYTFAKGAWQYVRLAKKPEVAFEVAD